MAGCRPAGRREGPPVMTRHPESANRVAVLRCRVADIGAPSIARIAWCEAAHDSVAGHLGNDGSGGDREAEGVSVDDRLHRAIDRRGDVAVDQCDVGAYAEDG